GHELAWPTGEPNWTYDQLGAGHDFENELGIPHYYCNDTRREHRWGLRVATGRRADPDAIVEMNAPARHDCALAHPSSKPTRPTPDPSARPSSGDLEPPPSAR